MNIQKRKTAFLPTLYPQVVAQALLLACAISGWVPQAQAASSQIAPTKAASSVRAEQARNALANLGPEIETLVKEMQIPSIAIGVVVDDEVVLAQGYGFRDAAKQLKADSQTLYPIASSTKPFTAFAAGTLVDVGKLDWDGPVQGYLPQFRLYSPELTNRVTMRDILSHRTGIPRHDLVHANYPEMTRSELLSRLPYLKPAHPLRERWEYSNLMYAVAGHVLEQLSGNSFEALVKEQVLQPLGMKASHMSIPKLKQQSNRALPYDEQDGKLSPTDYYPMQLGQPAGGLVSNVEDMTRWLRVNLSGGKLDGKQIINPTTLSELHKPQVLISQWPIDADYGTASYTLGWFHQAYKGHQVLFHSGRIEGFASNVSLYPYDNTGIVVMINKYLSSSVAEQISQHIADKLLFAEDAEKDQRLSRLAAGYKRRQAALQGVSAQVLPDFNPVRPLGEYAGRYFHPGYGELKVSVQQDRLQLRLNEVDTAFAPSNVDLFTGLTGAAKPYLAQVKLQFHGDSEGRVSALSLDLEPASGERVLFQRRDELQMESDEYATRVSGRYQAQGREFVVSRQGKGLVLSLSDSQHFELEADKNHRFSLKGLQQVAVQFVFDAKGEVGTMKFFQGPRSIEAIRKGE
ncbi:serine hydrolase [Shewanella sedimentimangrovi]|uniref:Serine hydrolase n=1 Tax=Shewanella sedimentimangrovi TaxID=2814293 RepID=A0ABX7R365_9GAMM|nr:serine hydrolase [Shewanella sedimentimangrovi]QSX38267.1 serine hydrolase [Shewanella sedimentimangrovi]